MSVPVKLADRLAAARNRDGGWPYAQGKASRIEPTCWALLGLARLQGGVPDASVLRAWPRRDGWLVEGEGVPPNVAFNALAALAMLAGRETAGAAAIVARVTAARGVALPPAPQIAQDNSLQAWPWIDGTFSWAEPTSWCLLLLKKHGAGRPPPAAAERIDIGERMLLDRASAAGGWNYGSARVFGRDLPPYVPTTALGLLALQDRAEHPVVVRALSRLREGVDGERSAVALALSAICLRTFGGSTSALDAALADHVAGAVARGADAGNLLGVAMALCALASDAPVDAFTLRG